MHMRTHAEPHMHCARQRTNGRSGRTTTACLPLSNTNSSAGAVSVHNKHVKCSPRTQPQPHSHTATQPHSHAHNHSDTHVHPSLRLGFAGTWPCQPSVLSQAYLLWATRRVLRHLSFPPQNPHPHAIHDAAQSLPAPHPTAATGTQLRCYRPPQASRCDPDRRLRQPQTRRCLRCQSQLAATAAGRDPWTLQILLHRQRTCTAGRGWVCMDQGPAPCGCRTRRCTRDRRH